MHGAELRDGLRSTVEQSGERAAELLVGSDYSRISRLTEGQLSEFRALCLKFLDPEQIEGPMRMLASGTRAMRQKGFEALESLVEKSLGLGGRRISDEAMAAAVERIGLSALLFDPHFAYRWRQHAALAKDKARSFTSFVSDPKNKRLMQRIVRRIGLDQLQRQLPDLASGLVSRAAWKLKSSSAQRDEVIKALEEARKELGDDAFFTVVFGKTRHLVQDNEAQVIESLKNILKSRKAPDPLRIDGLHKVFKETDPGHLQGGLGEALAARKLLVAAKKKAQQDGETIYVLLGNQVTAQRNLAPRRFPKGETSVPAVERMHSGEGVDALAVTVNDKKQILERIAAETKTSGRAAEQALEQADRTLETIEVVQSRSVEAVIRFEKDGTKTIMSLEEAAKQLGGEVGEVGTKSKRPALILSNEPNYAEDVLEARRKFDETGAAGPAPEELKLLRKGKFRRPPGAQKQAYAGRDQVKKVTHPDTDHRKEVAAEAQLRGVEFADYGAEYEAVRDVAMDVLSDTPMSRNAI